MPLRLPSLTRRALLGGAAALFATPSGPFAGRAGAQSLGEGLERLLSGAERLSFLRTVVVARDGGILAERGYRGHQVSAATNIKSASKPVISALVGIAIDRGVLEGIEQPVAPILRADVPADADPRVEEITLGHLMTMQAGLRPTSGPAYGRWVSSRNWVRAALGQPFEDAPGGRMLYSTGSTHLLSAVLTRVTGRSTLANARDWMADVEGFAIGGWQRDPQGIYLGGNEMGR